MCPVRKRTRRMEHEAPFPQQQQQKSNQMLRNEMKRSGLSMRNEREESELSGSINFRLLSSLPPPPSPSVKRFPWPLIDIEFFCLLFTSSRIITSTHHFSLFVALWRLILSNPTQPRKKKKPTTWYNNNNNHVRFTLKAITLHKNYTVQTEGNVSLASIHFDSLLRNVFLFIKRKELREKKTSGFFLLSLERAEIMFNYISGYIQRDIYNRKPFSNYWNRTRKFTVRSFHFFCCCCVCRVSQFPGNVKPVHCPLIELLLWFRSGHPFTWAVLVIRK